jgi:hypothetical protein
MSVNPSKRVNKICIVTTIKAPILDTVRFVNYHRNIGVDEIFLFFDDPDDPAIECVEDYDGVTCFRCDSDHWKALGNPSRLLTGDRLTSNASFALALVRERGFSWIIHIDSDELILPDGDLKTLLAKSQSDVVRFAISEAVPEKLVYDSCFEPVLFRKLPSRPRKQKKRARRLGCGGAFVGGEYFRGHEASKTAVRVSANIDRLGIHGPQTKGQKLPVARTNEIRLLHFDSIGVASWKGKWTQRIDKRMFDQPQP